MTAPVLPTAGNRMIVAALLAVIRAQRMTPGFDRDRVAALASQLDLALFGENTAESIAALSILLLKGIGINDPRELRELMNG